MASCCDLPAGARRTPVLVERLAAVSDGLRGEQRTFVALRTIFCKCVFKSGREPFTRDALRPEATYKVYAIYADASDITEEDRFDIEGTPYQIRAINNVEFRNKVIEFDCERGVAQ